MATTNPSVAPGWEKWADWTLRQQQAVVDWLLRSAGVAPGMTVLDVASGVGQPALQMATRVVPGGKIIATDVAADMLAACERGARALAITNIELRELDMHDLRGIADASIDAVTCSFALMFSPDPVKVAREVRRVLKPGARFAACVWDEPAKNPYFTTMFGAMASVVPMPPPPLDAPGPFKLAAPGELARVLGEAGFREIAVESVPSFFEFDSVDQHWEISCDLASPLKRAVTTLPAPEVTRLKEAFGNALEPYVEAGRVRILTTPLCASGSA